MWRSDKNSAPFERDILTERLVLYFSHSRLMFSHKATRVAVSLALCSSPATITTVYNSSDIKCCKMQCNRRDRPSKTLKFKLKLTRCMNIRALSIIELLAANPRSPERGCIQRVGRPNHVFQRMYL